jgi:hypothetical protein
MRFNQSGGEITVEIAPLPRSRYLGALDPLGWIVAHAKESVPEFYASVKFVRNNSAPNSDLKIYNLKREAGDLSLYETIGLDILSIDEATLAYVKSNSASDEENRLVVFYRGYSRINQDAVYIGVFLPYPQIGEYIYYLNDEYALDYNPSANLEYCLPLSVKDELQRYADDFWFSQGFHLPEDTYCGGKCDEGMLLDKETGKCECEEGKYYHDELKKCVQKTTKTFYINGAYETDKKAGNTLDTIRLEFREPFDSKETSEFEVGYNYTANAFMDFWEVIEQKQKADGLSKDAMEILASIIMLARSGKPTAVYVNRIPKSALQEILDKTKSADIEDVIAWGLENISQLKALESINAATINSQISSSLASNKRVILITHGQGALFGAQAMKKFGVSGEFVDSVGMISAGSLSGDSFAKHFYYQTAFDDRIVNLFRVAYNVLSANIDNNVFFLDHRGFTNHDFYFGYFNNYQPLPSYTNIAAFYNKLKAELKYPRQSKE